MKAILCTWAEDESDALKYMTFSAYNRAFLSSERHVIFPMEFYSFFPLIFPFHVNRSVVKSPEIDSITNIANPFMMSSDFT